MFIKYKPFIGIMALALLGAMLSKPVLAENLDLRATHTVQAKDYFVDHFAFESELMPIPAKFKDFQTCLTICKKNFPNERDPARAACVRNCEKVLPPGK